MWDADSGCRVSGSNATISEDLERTLGVGENTQHGAVDIGGVAEW